MRNRVLLGYYAACSGNTIRCVVAQKSAVLIYLSAEA